MQERSDYLNMQPTSLSEQNIEPLLESDSVGEIDRFLNEAKKNGANLLEITISSFEYISITLTITASRVYYLNRIVRELRRQIQKNSAAIYRAHNMSPIALKELQHIESSLVGIDYSIDPNDNDRLKNLCQRLDKAKVLVDFVVQDRQ